MDAYEHNARATFNRIMAEREQEQEEYKQLMQGGEQMKVWIFQPKEASIVGCLIIAAATKKAARIVAKKLDSSYGKMIPSEEYFTEIDGVEWKGTEPAAALVDCIDFKY